MKTTRIVPWDFDEATYVGDEEDGVYYQVARKGQRCGWYMTAVVDCNTASFCDNLIVDDGPYDTEAEAEEAGKNAAVEWCVNNYVNYEEEA